MKKLLLLTLTIALVACKVQNPNLPTTSVPGTAGTENVQIGVPTARKMVHKYHPNTFDLRVKTRAVWLSKERIGEIYHNLLEDSANKMGTDGIRIYFAKYPRKDSLGKRYLHPHQNTLIIVSTKKDGSSHLDYFTGAHNAISNKMIPENKGELCPPGDCNGAELLKKN